MIKRKTILSIIILTALIFTGCSFFRDLFNLPLTIEQRIEAFETSINQNPRSADDILNNFGPKDQMVNYNQAKALSYWDAAFPSDRVYLFTAGSISDPQNITVTAEERDNNGNNLGESTYRFRMHKEENDNWLIREIYEIVSGGNEETIIRKIIPE